MFLENKGFTLLEVMIAMMVMVMALGSIMSVEESCINAVFRAKSRNNVRILAKNKMIETEFELSSLSFEEIEKKKEGRFDEPFQDYRFQRIVKEVHLPNFGSIENSDNQTGQQTEVNQVLQRQITQYLSDSLREVTVVVLWDKSGKEQSFSLTQYMVNLNRVLSFAAQ
jgi:prepilin-type N-terminal cleavage/methylation domain-containing protein